MGDRSYLTLTTIQYMTYEYELSTNKKEQTSLNSTGYFQKESFKCN